LLSHSTVDQFVKRGLASMARAFTELQDNQGAACLGHAAWLALLLGREATERSNRQLTASLRHAKLPISACPSCSPISGSAAATVAIAG
jgi:hypothetical protein